MSGMQVEILIIAVLTAVACAGVWLQLLVFSQYNLPHIWVAPGLVLAALAQEANYYGFHAADLMDLLPA